MAKPDGRYSSPPTDASLNAATARHRAANDRHELALAGVVPVALNDEQRLAAFRELAAYQYKHGQVHLDQAMYAFEREIRDRMAARKASSP